MPDGVLRTTENSPSYKPARISTGCGSKRPHETLQMLMEAHNTPIMMLSSCREIKHEERILSEGRKNDSEQRKGDYGRLYCTLILILLMLMRYYYDYGGIVGIFIHVLIVHYAYIYCKHSKISDGKISDVIQSVQAGYYTGCT
jgi:hypothetical protein